MEPTTIFVRTLAGLDLLSSESAAYAPELVRVLALIDGNTSVAQLAERDHGLAADALERVLSQLESRGAIVRAEQQMLARAANDTLAPGTTTLSRKPVPNEQARREAALVAQAQATVSEGEVVQLLGRTPHATPEKLKHEVEALAAARARAEAEAKALQAAREKAEAEAKALNEARQAAEAEARRLSQETESRARRLAAREREALELQSQVEAESRRKQEEIERRKDEEAARIRADAQAAAKAADEARRRAESDLAARLAEERGARERAEALAEEERQRRLEYEQKEQAIQEEKRRRKEEEAQIRREAEERAHLLAEMRDKLKLEPIAAPPHAVVLRRLAKVKPMRVVWGVLGLVVVLSALAVLSLPLIPSAVLVGPLERVLSAWVGAQVTIAHARATFWPQPSMSVDSVETALPEPLRMRQLRFVMPWSNVASGKFVATQIEADDVQMPWTMRAALRRIVATPAADGVVRARRLIARGIRLGDVAYLDSLEADVVLDESGRVRTAALSASNRSWSSNWRPGGEAWLFDASASTVAASLVPWLSCANARASGKWEGDSILIEQWNAQCFGGTASGVARIAHAGSAVSATLEGKASGVDVAALMRVLTKDFVLTGTGEISFNATAQAPSVPQLVPNARVQGRFTASDGSLGSVDLVESVRVIEGPGRAGQTRFELLSGNFAWAGGRTQWRDLKLSAGPLGASGSLDVREDSAMSGYVGAEVRSRIASQSGRFNIAGTVAKPELRR